MLGVGTARRARVRLMLVVVLAAGLLASCSGAAWGDGSAAPGGDPAPETSSGGGLECEVNYKELDGTANCVVEEVEKLIDLGGLPCDGEVTYRALCLAATADQAVAGVLCGQWSRTSSLAGTSSAGAALPSQTITCVSETLERVLGMEPCPSSDAVDKAVCLAETADAVVAAVVCGAALEAPVGRSLEVWQPATVSCVEQKYAEFLASEPCPASDPLAKLVCLAAYADRSVASVLCGSWAERTGQSATVDCALQTYGDLLAAKPCPAADPVAKTVCLVALADHAAAQTLCADGVTMSRFGGTLETLECAGEIYDGFLRSEPCAADDEKTKALCLVALADRTVAGVLCAGGITMARFGGTLQTLECLGERYDAVIRGNPCPADGEATKALCLVRLADHTAATVLCADGVTSPRFAVESETVRCLGEIYDAVLGSEPCPSDDEVDKAGCVIELADHTAARGRARTGSRQRALAGRSKQSSAPARPTRR